MVVKPSHGDGRFMSVAEARARRERAKRSGREDIASTGREQDRRWASLYCRADTAPDGRSPVLCGRPATGAEDVGLFDGRPVAMCSRCRAALGGGDA
jgi:hypothetical protein